MQQVHFQVYIRSPQVLFRTHLRLLAWKEIYDPRLDSAQKQRKRQPRIISIEPAEGEPTGTEQIFMIRQFFDENGTAYAELNIDG